jgi:hypothetical protein
MAGTAWKAGPAFLAAAAADVAGVNPATNTYRKIFHIHLTNTNAAARTVSLYIGATGGSAAGTEILKAKSIAANDVFDMYFPAGLRIVAADFLSGLSSVDATSVTIEVNGESFVL